MDAGERSPLFKNDANAADAEMQHPFAAPQSTPLEFSRNGGDKLVFRRSKYRNSFIERERALKDEDDGGASDAYGRNLGADMKAMSLASLYLGDSKDMDESEPEAMENMCHTPNDNCSARIKTCLNGPENPFGPDAHVDKSLFFSDGQRSVDFVLAWSPDTNETAERSNIEKRSIFEQNLINEGLQLENETIDEDFNFVKIHAPIEVLRRYSSILRLRLPMKEIPGLKGVRHTTNKFVKGFKDIFTRSLRYVLVDEKHFPKKSHRFTAVYSRDKEYLFDIQQTCFFTSAVRSRIVQFILDRKKFAHGENDDFRFGIERLIADNVYLAAYPLHDGDIDTPGCMRSLLYKEWASLSKWFRYQPLDYIKDYFGVKIGLYFAWLGFYTYMLLLASVVGFICFTYSLLTFDYDVPSNDICSGKMDAKMCPLCDHWCNYWDLKESCVHARITYLIDNPTTVFFAIFMSFWAALFLELWKRYSAEITHRWDLTGFDVHEEHPRPEYLARLAHVKKVRIDYVTNTREPQPPFWRMKLPATVFSFSMVILLICLAFAAVLGVVLYRMSVLAALPALAEMSPQVLTTTNAVIFTSVTAACINLCLIFVFNYMYTYLAQYLTELELLRTQTEFDDSLTLKIYLLQFVNYYASIFYIAFFKGKFVGRPGAYTKFLKYRQEECGYGGCLMELTIQLTIIMIGKQGVNAILEMLIPFFYKWLMKLKVKFLSRNKGTDLDEKTERWIKDLELLQWGSRSLFPEYLEMVLQYGFATIFVAAFPLAPLFALLNNILEVRLDAQKLLKHFRRPVSQRVRNIGIWYKILDSIGKLSVITNGLIIAFTSNFIPRLVYRATHNNSLEGYLNYTLAYFDTSDFKNESVPVLADQNVTICRYSDFREPPEPNHTYNRTSEFYLILAARLGFVVIFENIVALVMIFVRWLIPDVPPELRDKIRREAYITNEIIIKQEALRARVLRASEERDDIDVEPNVNFIKMEQLLSGNLSQSQLDLVMHGNDAPTGPGHCPPSMHSPHDDFLAHEAKPYDDGDGPVLV